jgi:hypothetical protein
MFMVEYKRKKVQKNTFSGPLVLPFFSGCGNEREFFFENFPVATTANCSLSCHRLCNPLLHANQRMPLQKHPRTLHLNHHQLHEPRPVSPLFMSARVDGAGAPLVAAGSKIGSKIEDYLEKFSVQPLLKSVAASVVRNQPSDPVSFIISELKHWKTPQLAVQPPLNLTLLSFILLLSLVPRLHPSLRNLLPSSLAKRPQGKDPKRRCCRPSWAARCASVSPPALMQ